VEKKSEIFENFKTAISSTVKSLSNSENIEVSFGNQNTKSEKDLINLPEIEQVQNKINYDKIRAIADSKSLNYRFSNKKTLELYEPAGNVSKKLYKIAEKIRCEKIGSDHFKGVKNNIEKFYQKRLNSLDFKSSEDKILESFENYLRINLLNIKNNKEIDKKLKTYLKDIDKRFKNKIQKLSDFTQDQKSFNSLISSLISEMSLDDNLNEDVQKDENINKDETQTDPKNQEQKADKQKQEKQEMSIDSGVPDLENQSRESDQNTEEMEIEDNSKPDLRRNGKNLISDLKYRTYTEEFDEVVKADELENEEELNTAIEETKILKLDEVNIEKKEKKKKRFFFF